MTRMIKYAQKRRAIETENTIFYLEQPRKWLVLKKYQWVIKLLEGYKH